jgi:hypothetical protein
MLWIRLPAWWKHPPVMPRGWLAGECWQRSGRSRSARQSGGSELDGHRPGCVGHESSWHPLLVHWRYGTTMLNDVPDDESTPLRPSESGGVGSHAHGSRHHGQASMFWLFWHHIISRWHEFNGFSSCLTIVDPYGSFLIAATMPKLHDVMYMPNYRYIRFGVAASITSRPEVW